MPRHSPAASSQPTASACSRHSLAAASNKRTQAHLAHAAVASTLFCLHGCGAGGAAARSVGIFLAGEAAQAARLIIDLHEAPGALLAGTLVQHMPHACIALLGRNVTLASGKREQHGMQRQAASNMQQHAHRAQVSARCAAGAHAHWERSWRPRRSCMARRARSRRLGRELLAARAARRVACRRGASCYARQARFGGGGSAHAA